MSRARDLLERFRPVGTPGAAAPAGVPADRGAELADELQPVFDALTAVEDECVALRADASRRAEERRAGAAERARVLVATAVRDADAERADAAARGRARATEDSAATIAAAGREAARIHDAAGARMDALVERVVAAVRAGAGPTR